MYTTLSVAFIIVCRKPVSKTGDNYKYVFHLLTACEGMASLGLVKVGKLRPQQIQKGSLRLYYGQFFLVQANLINFLPNKDSLKIPLSLDRP